MQLFGADTTIYLYSFFPQKLKNHPQKLLRKTHIHFFLTALSCLNGTNRIRYFYDKNKKIYSSYSGPIR